MANFRKLTASSLTFLTLPLLSPWALPAIAQDLKPTSYIAQAEPAQTPGDRAFAEGMALFRQKTPESIQAAIQKLEEALTLYQQEGNQVQEGNTLSNIGAMYFILQDFDTALSYYNRALPLQQQIDDKTGVAFTLNKIARLYEEQGDSQKALDYYSQSVPLFHEEEDKPVLADTLNTIGFLQLRSRDFPAALESYNQALALHQEIGNLGGAALSLLGMGRIKDQLGEKQSALEYYNQALTLRRQLGDKGEESLVLSNIGKVYSDLGEKQTAIEYYNQALSIQQEIGNQAAAATILNNLGRVYESSGDWQAALNHYEQSLSLLRDLGNRQFEAFTLSNIGSVKSTIGEKQTALDYYNQAANILRELGDQSSLASIINNMGAVYDDLGDKKTALDYYTQSLAVLQKLGDKVREASTINNIGYVYNYLGDKQKALEYYNRALPLYREIGYKEGVALSLSNIGLLYSDLGDNQQALEYLNQALVLEREVGNKRGESITLGGIGVIYFKLQDFAAALDYYQQSLPLARQTGDRDATATTLYNLAGVARAQGKLQEGITYIEEAITIIEDLRQKVDSSELRSSFFAEKYNYYELYIDMLMQLHRQQPQAGYDSKALQVSERSRARTLLELLTEANADIRSGVDPKLRLQEISLQEKVNTAAQRQVEILSAEHTPEQANAIQQQLDQLLRELDGVRADIRTTSPRYAALTQPQPLTLAQMQALLDENTLLLQYSLGETRSYLWAVSKTEITSYELPARKEIETATLSFRDAIISPALRIRKARALEAAQKLSELILSPVADKLGEKRLVIVSDRDLHYIPFAALSLPGNNGEPLIVKHEIINLPSASTLAILRQETSQRPPAPKTLAVLADPVFAPSDPRVQAQSNGDTTNTTLLTPIINNAARDVGITGELARLPNTRSEAQTLLTLVPEANDFSAFDFAANRQTATSEQMANYQIIHFATHGFFNAQNPQLSGLVMSLVDEKGQPVDGFLRLHDIYNLNLAADLVVLSACQTGLGEIVKGEGISGLTRGFMYAGTPRLVASLWSVDDAATAALMSKFYREMLQNKMRPAAALRAAQLEMLQSREWDLPYFWAAFGFQGEWR
ncbi:MAG TPA: CHAT domain-containing protein [Oscillatoriaceae cyanobacterium M33_DOE_052]|uniref:Tetratricopeptide repeat protein n=1 Tax=Planktothricoides sp. SpSt-374 TaxID=2282167 RepID=A0A7C3VK66_9CYAN|nr:CHAT domain-containing protein [Oscillatoriaceae cyanobacterium M33_DOE_052]